MINYSAQRINLPLCTIYFCQSEFMCKKCIHLICKTKIIVLPLLSKKIIMKEKLCLLAIQTSWMKVCVNLLLCVGLITCFSSCSKEDDEEDVKVEFSLLNDTGSKTTIFKVGENITFDLKVTNQTNEMVYLTDTLNAKEIIKAFFIYTANGKVVGTPYDMQTSDKAYIPQKSSIHWQACWMIKPTERDEDYYDPFFIENIKEPLPQGDYYTLFSYIYKGERKEYRLSFKITQ